jgi:hypothetical protein
MTFARHALADLEALAYEAALEPGFMAASPGGR